MKIEFKPFDAKTVPLAGINLIEASAGTGKTYSIAILALRLITENQIPIEKILMVTFTKAAVAELEERIRLFVRLAHRAAQNEIIEDQNIVDLLKNSKNTQETNLELLKKAILFLDETSIVTIHSFCQQTLTEFAFETHQLFGAELLQDTNAILQDEIEKFWRESVTSIPTELLFSLLNNGLSRERLKLTVKKHLEGKSFFAFDENEDYRLEKVITQEVITDIKTLSEREKELWKMLENNIIDNYYALEAATLKNAYCTKNTLHLLKTPNDFLNFLWGKKDLSNIIKTYQNIINELEEWNTIIESINQNLKDIINKITCQAIHIAGKGTTDFKGRNNQMSFDDLINNLNAAILKPDNTKLIDGLRKKYEAVFIDEFQDTDRKQHQIFDKAFSAETIVFYIGDPKQSIYAFRKADIFTYFEAQKAADNCYGMNQNFRSSKPYIEAMNLFFNPVPDFDPFHFGNAEQTISYFEVNASEKNKHLDFLKENKPEPPLTITFLNKKDTIVDAVASQIAELLKSDSPFSIQSNPVILSEAKNLEPVIQSVPVIQSTAKNLTTVILSAAKNLKTRKIIPSDIVVLVRARSDAHKIQTQLSKLNIPSVIDKEDKVLQSAEAKFILYFLEALVDINRKNINKALLTPFTGYKQKDIINLDLQYATELFKNYHTLFVNDGVFTAIKSFTSHYQTNTLLISSHTENGEKILSNLYQITELLHKTETNKNLNAVDLIHWLKRGIDGCDNPGDEYIQRMESDEEAVKIVTIHSSKGLEFNIVFAPFLDFIPNSNHPQKATRLCDFRNPESGQYQSFTNYAAMNDAEKALHDQQEKQENSRLIYVTLTRAVYKCFIYKSKSSNSPMVYFVDALKNADANLIAQTNDFPNEIKLNLSKPILQNKINKPVIFELKQNYWRKMSYSFLKAPYQYFPKSKSNLKLGEYDNFIFTGLARGAKAGNLLHYIFENIQLNNESSWEKAIQNAITLYSIKDVVTYKSMLPKMLHHILNTTISFTGINFKLSSVEAKKCINEFEFDFSVSPFKVPQLKNLEEENLEINLGLIYDLEGVMNGKIDLFFEHQGKYFVLDWKSNYLGDSLENYSPTALNQAMNESNYHLQYLIYCLASKKYLQSRLPHFNYETDFGGVIYLYVRGVREDSSTGIFVTKPSLQKMDMLERILDGDKILV